MNHLLYSTGVSLIENKHIPKGNCVFLKESNELLVENIYPFMFLGCGSLYSIDQCVEFSVKYALDKLNRLIDLKVKTWEAYNNLEDIIL